MKNKDLARLDLWEIGTRAFLREPLGYGPDTFGYLYDKDRTTAMTLHTNVGVLQAHAHNGPLQLLCTLGLFGTLAVAWLISRAKWSKPEAAALIALGVNLLLNPSSLEVLCCAAFVFGCMATMNADWKSGYVTKVLMICLSLISVSGAAWYGYAELRPVKAVDMLPCETEWALRYSWALPDAIEQTKDPAMLYARAENVARLISDCRPNTAFGRLAAARIYWFGAQLGIPDRLRKSREHAEAAKILAPHMDHVEDVRRGLDEIEKSR